MLATINSNFPKFYVCVLNFPENSMFSNLARLWIERPGFNLPWQRGGNFSSVIVQTGCFLRHTQLPLK